MNKHTASLLFLVILWAAGSLSVHASSIPFGIHITPSESVGSERSTGSGGSGGGSSAGSPSAPSVSSPSTDSPFEQANPPTIDTPQSRETPETQPTETPATQENAENNPETAPESSNTQSANNTNQPNRSVAPLAPRNNTSQINNTDASGNPVLQESSSKASTEEASAPSQQTPNTGTAQVSELTNTITNKVTNFAKQVMELVAEVTVKIGNAVKLTATTIVRAVAMRFAQWVSKLFG